MLACHAGGLGLIPRRGIGGLNFFHLLHDIFSKCQWIFTKLAVCIDIVQIGFGNANGQVLSIFDRVICLGYDSGWVLLFHILLHLNTPIVAKVGVLEKLRTEWQTL